MGKISPVSAKYIINAHIEIDGIVDRPDVIGAIFGQTEGLLGAELELRELQRSGRIGRIDVKTEVRAGKATGEIIVPSSLDKAETSIIGAAIETIQRIGPCNAKVRIQKIEDVRITKRTYVIERAKELLRELTDSVLPNSQELTDQVAESVRMMEVAEFGKDRLPAGPAIEENEEIIVVEGRADVLNLLRHGIKNAIAMNGTSVPETIKELSKKKHVTLFVDGDRGGDLIIREVSIVAEIDYVVKAPDGKEVEEITQKEIHKALRSRVAIEQYKLENKDYQPKTETRQRYGNSDRYVSRERHEVRVERSTVAKVSSEHQENFKKMLTDLVGTRGAYILDENLSILGKVPITEIVSTLRSLNSGVFAVIFDGIVTPDITNIAERTNVQYVVGMDSKVTHSRVKILTQKQL
ncbi:MAG TPA: DNA primase DnaG [Candidatus Nanoarchaeia archaeon]|nr:DNA primase [Candidatus Woesearchaeota archaeon]HLC37564.1 DNA primase DnaG [Candidatus Nanoarchaeia archaeon]